MSRRNVLTRELIKERSIPEPMSGCWLWEGAPNDDDGMFFDGQPLICGCPGLVCIDDGGAEDDDSNEIDRAWISNGDDPCLNQKCPNCQLAPRTEDQT